MRKFIACVLALMLVGANPGFAGSIMTSNVLTSAYSSSIAVASTDTVYTKSFDISDAEYFSVAYTALSAAGSVSVTIQYEQSTVAPTTEGSADANFTIPVGASDIVTSHTTETTWFRESFTPIAQRFIRFKITGTGANNADTIVQMKFSRKQD